MKYPLEHDFYVDAIRTNGAALAAAAGNAGVAASVPSCPEWTVAELLGHIGRLHRWVAAMVADGVTERGAHWSEAEPPPPEARVEWFAAGVPMLADALAAAGPGAEVWSWTSDQSSGFWSRRQAHETAMHRVDAELAAGTNAPIERVLAVDGIDEFFDLIPFWAGRDRLRGNGETVHLHCNDADAGRGEWLVRLDPDGVEVARAHGKGDVAAQGTASDLLLYLYGRGPVDALEVFGDAALLARWRELASW